MKQIMMALAFGIFLTASMQSQAKGIDITKGKNAFETCRGCHSTPNYSSVAPTYYVPKIGGQRKGYLASALATYKNGARPSKSMLANTYNLSDKTTEAIALHIEQSAGKKAKAPYTGDPSKGKKLAATCLSCHTNDLKDGATAPILAGQYGNYLVKVMQEYQSGKRKDVVMQNMLADFSKEDLEDIASYFADMEGLSIVK
jgi:cytochrome c553